MSMRPVIHWWTRQLPRSPSVLHDRAGADVDWSELAGIYVVGGAGSFPLIARSLRNAFDEKRVKRSLHPFAATAIGLAAFLDQEAGFVLCPNAFRATSASFAKPARARMCTSTRSSPKGAELPTAGEPPVVVTRTYRAAHNIGHFRFVEAPLVTGRSPRR